MTQTGSMGLISAALSSRGTPGRNSKIMGDFAPSDKGRYGRRCRSKRVEWDLGSSWMANGVPKELRRRALMLGAAAEARRWLIVIVYTK